MACAECTVTEVTSSLDLAWEGKNPSLDWQAFAYHPLGCNLLDRWGFESIFSRPLSARQRAARKVRKSRQALFRPGIAKRYSEDRIHFEYINIQWIQYLHIIAVAPRSQSGDDPDYVVHVYPTLSYCISEKGVFVAAFSGVHPIETWYLMLGKIRQL